MNCIKTYNLTLAAKYINPCGLTRSNMAGPKRADGALSVVKRGVVSISTNTCIKVQQVDLLS